MTLSDPLVATNVRIHQERLWDSLMDIATIGPGVAGGNNRQALTDEDGEARKLFVTWCEGAGLTVSVDQIGNIFATRPGTETNALPVCMGSHLDTQPTGGRFDGVLGVLAGLEVIRTLNDQGIQTRHPITLVNWTNEEGSRFAPVMMASGVFAGAHPLEWAYDRRDASGIRFGDELERIGWKGSFPVGGLSMKAYFELHIEQGPILEAENVDIGIVTSGQGLTWLEIDFHGRSAHAGSTPMNRRHDAALGAARLVHLVNAIANDRHPNAVGTVGRLSIEPNTTNSVAAYAQVAIDIRSPVAAMLEEMEAEIRSGAESIAAEIGLSFEIRRLQHAAPVHFAPDCISSARQAAVALGYSHRDIVSGAGHDAYWISRVAPSAMIMCPCVDGISHNEAEEIFPEWAAAGADVLLHAVLDNAVKV
ncbi:Zn-dependent hydrolase [Rhizobium leguminosarum]|uniref:Zn-dependent hydrolase n=1 Tax=Rhizobium leguminosarum TaxID=384 RepID=UPI0024A876C8|nr:Zn-dependent hydrolase [Rhizobium leguminosarum]MDI5929685.1 Zn-dependent hydrolase [Rhizobium leguminosarum]